MERHRGRYCKWQRILTEIHRRTRLLTHRYSASALACARFRRVRYQAPTLSMMKITGARTTAMAVQARHQWEKRRQHAYAHCSTMALGPITQAANDYRSSWVVRICRAPELASRRSPQMVEQAPKALRYNFEIISDT
jgi:hypothetical protein